MEELRLKLVNLCNESGLPLEAILFVVRDVYRDVDGAFRAFLENQEKQEEKENGC